MRAYAPVAKTAAFAAPSRARRQRDAAADRQLLDEHAPALARHLRAADDGSRAARTRPCPGSGRSGTATFSGKCRRPIVDAGRVTRDQRAGDAVVGAIAAEQALGIEQLEREAEHRRDRRQRDVALREVQAHADDLAALVHAFADDAGVGNRRRIGAGARPGEREARHFFAARESRQLVIASALRCRSEAAARRGRASSARATVDATTPERLRRASRARTSARTRRTPGRRTSSG